MDEHQQKAIIELAVRLGLVGRCDRCGEIWDLCTVDIGDDDMLDEYLDCAEDIIDAEPALDVFNDAGSLRKSLVKLLGDASSDKSCEH